MAIREMTREEYQREFGVAPTITPTQTTTSSGRFSPSVSTFDPNKARAVSDFLGTTKIGQGIGQTAANIGGAQRGMAESQDALMNTQNQLISQIRNNKAQGKDTSRLESALKALTDEIISTGGQVEELGTGGLTGKEVVGSALQTGATVGAVGLRPAGSILGRIAQAAGLGGVFGGSRATSEGKSAQDIAKSTAIGVGVGAAIGGAVEGVKYAVRGLPKLLSYTSDTPQEVLQRNYDNPQALAEATKQLKTEGAQGILKDVQASIRQLRKTLTTQYQEGSNALIKMHTDKTFGFSEGSKTAGLFSKVEDRFAIDLPQNMANISLKEGLALNAELNRLLQKPMIASSADGVIVRKAKDLLEQKLASYDGVQKFLSNYGTEKQVLDAADALFEAYKTNNPLAQTTALSRLRNAFNANRPAYLSALTDLEKATGVKILDKASTLATQKIAPKAGGNIINQIVGLLLPITSPRGAAALSRTAGRVGASEIGAGAGRNLLIKTGADFLAK